MYRKVIVLLNLFLLILFTASAMLSLVLPSPCQAQTKHPNGWYWPAGTSEPGGLIGWLVLNPKNNEYHLGQDFKSNVEAPVYALADGVVLYSRTDVSGYGPGDTKGGALVALFKTSTGEEFKALYGHINKPLSEGSSIKAGEILGYINEYDPPHLHLGIHPGKELPPDGNPWRGYTEDKGNTYGWIDPLAFLNNNHPPLPPAPSPLEMKLKWRVYTGFVTSIQMTKDAIFVGSDDAVLYAISPLTGKVLWNFRTEKGVVNSALGDLDGDGKIEVVVGDSAGYIYCLNDSGTQKWKFKTEIKKDSLVGIFSTAIKDMDDDGKLEAIAIAVEAVLGSEKAYGYIYCLSDLGILKWKFKTEAFLSSLAIGDIDSDGESEVVVGGSASEGGETYGYVYCLSNLGILKWRFKADVDVVLSSPVIGDVDGDGELEIVVGGFVLEEGKTYGGYVYCLSNWGILKWKFKADTDIFLSSPAIGDIDDDGESDVVVEGIVYTEERIERYVYCLSNPGILKWESRIWEVRKEEMSEEEKGFLGFALIFLPSLPFRPFPAIGDIDGDGKLDVAGRGYVLSDSGALKWKFETGGEVYAELLYPSLSAIGDMDGDGKLEVVFAGSDEHLYAFDAPGAGRVVWAKAHGDSWNTGQFEDALSYGEYAASGFPGIWTPGFGKVSTGTPWDVNGDGKVDIFDLALVGQNFEKKTKEADVNGDGVVDIFDLVLVGQRFGEKYK